MTTVPEPATPSPVLDHPIRLVVTDDLARSRLTVFFRLLLAIPHFIWLGLWGIAVFVLAIINWVAVIFTGKPPDGLHRMFTMYLRYATHVYAYVSIAANPYPGFVGDPGYPVDLEIDPPAPQGRLGAFFRLILAIPALVLTTVLVGFGGGTGSRTSGSEGSTSAGVRVVGVLAAAALVSWFYAMFRARAPRGVARVSWYAIHYAAQSYAYLLLVTDRYPNSDPELLGVPEPLPDHPIKLRLNDDALERSRLTVFFRLLLAFPHLVWLALWSILTFFAALANWIVTLIRGQSPEGLHNFLAAYQRYTIHVYSFITLIANPFPGFTGAPGYPVDLEVAPPERQGRWWTLFRFFLAIPAIIIGAGIGATLYVAGFLGWFASLFTGRMPRGLRNLGAFALRYSAQTNGFTFLLLTSRYPYAGPPA